MIEAKRLTKKYGDLVAVNDISFRIERGEIFGILGQNGAGKTTLVEMLEGIYPPTSGSIQVEGFKSIHDNVEYKKIIGVQLQHTAIHDNMKVAEILRLFSFFHRVPDERAFALLKEFGLESKRNSLYRRLSGGEARMVQLVLTFFHDPRIVFLDEPTTGLDPIARRMFWEFVKKNKKEGQTLVMTTHYVEEAQALCDRIAILKQGNVLRLDPPQKMIQECGHSHKIVVPLPFSPTGPEIKAVEHEKGQSTVYTSEPLSTLKRLLAHLEQHRTELSSVAMESTTLEDVYVELLGEKTEGPRS